MDAQLTTGAQLERVCRKYRQLRRNVDGANPADDDRDRYLRRRDLDNGMVSIEAVCHPEEAALIWAVIEQATKEIYAARLAPAADLCDPADREAVSGAGCNPAPGASAEVQAALNACGSASQGFADAAIMNRTACDPAAQASSEATPEGVSAEACSGASGARGAAHACRGHANESELDDDSDAHDAEAFDDADEYEKDCAFFEQFGVCPEPPPALRAHDVDLIAPVNAPINWTTRSSSAAQSVGQSAAQSRASGNQPARPPFNRLDGLLALARKFATGDSAKTPIEVVVTVSAEALANRTAPDECIAFVDDDGCISAEAARRMSCDAGIVCMVEDANGNPLSVGRRTRSIPTSIGRALRKRDKCCRFPGCTNRLFVDGHHIKHWALGGETVLSNLVRLCTRHHKFVHEYGYRVEMDADGWPHFFDPQGRPAKDVPTRILGDDLGWPHIEEANRDLGIEAHVCGWSGERVDYNEVCRALYLLDEGLLKANDVC